MSPIVHNDLSNEETRWYTVISCGSVVIEKRFDYPRAVTYGPDHTFHRVHSNTDEVFLMPAPGFIYHNGVVVGFCLVSFTLKK